MSNSSDGTGSSDPEMDILTYLWTAPGIVFNDPTDVMASATFPLGNTTVTLTVSDGEFDDTDEMSAEVKDTTAPIINISLNPDVLWPPNHKLRDISATVNVTDTCDANPTFALTSIISNEPDNGKGDGNTTGDIAEATVGTADIEFKLRAERDGRNSGREYTTTYTGSDGSGNESSTSTTVSVPHNKP